MKELFAQLALATQPDDGGGGYGPKFATQPDDGGGGYGPK
jgi:hypothetical protein